MCLNVRPDSGFQKAHRRSTRRWRLDAGRLSRRILRENSAKGLAIRLDGIPHKGEALQRPLAGNLITGTTSIANDDGNEAEVGTMPDRRLNADSIATPTMAKAVRLQSRRAMASGVPSKADMVILSKIASSSRGASSGTISKPGEPRRNQGWTWRGSSTRCQAMAMQNWNALITSAARTNAA